MLGNLVNFYFGLTELRVLAAYSVRSCAGKVASLDPHKLARSVQLLYELLGRLKRLQGEFWFRALRAVCSDQAVPQTWKTLQKLLYRNGLPRESFMCRTFSELKLDMLPGVQTSFKNLFLGKILRTPAEEQLFQYLAAETDTKHGFKCVQPDEMLKGSLLEMFFFHLSLIESDWAVIFPITMETKAVQATSIHPYHRRHLLTFSKFVFCIHMKAYQHWLIATLDTDRGIALFYDSYEPAKKSKPMKAEAQLILQGLIAKYLGNKKLKKVVYKCGDFGFQSCGPFVKNACGLYAMYSAFCIYTGHPHEMLQLSLTEQELPQTDKELSETEKEISQTELEFTETELRRRFVMFLASYL